MNEIRREVVGSEQEGMELISFISQKISVSRRKAKQLIDSRIVYVNNKCVWIAHHNLRKGDLVEFSSNAIEETGQEKSIKVLYRDKEYLIVDKPSGITANQSKDSLEVLLQRRYNHSQIRAAHRLDKYTSGCMIFALTFNAFERIVELFRLKKVLKSYVAIVYGRIGKQKMLINFPIDMQEAITELCVIKVAEEASFIRLFPKTGRTHQLRIHLAEIGHPIIGDNQYGSRKIYGWQGKMVLRQSLHSDYISFTSPFTGNVVKAHSELPDDFCKALKLFKLM
jgi:23S rRNA pseudouridine1911/1915/1917 synthase